MVIVIPIIMNSSKNIQSDLNESALENTNTYVFSCNYPGCDKVFMTAFSSKRHKLVHTKERPFACEVCGKRFGLVQHLKEHTFRHSKVKPYICGINGCQEAFRHVLPRHGLYETSESDEWFLDHATSLTVSEML